MIIPHNRPTIGLDEKKALSKVVESKYLSMNKEVERFEDEFARYHKLSSGNAVAVSNGTSALYIVLKFLNTKNKKVVLPTYSCSSLLHATKLAGAKAVIQDIKKDSPNMDAELLKKNNFQIFAHMYGLPSILKNKNLIEDCCQSLGAKINNKLVGLQGKASIFSFYSTKLITSAGQGGMILSKDKSLIREIKDFLDFDMRKDEKFRFNFQMTDIQAAFGRAQLKKMNIFISKRKKIFNFYKNLGLNLLENKDKKINQIYYRSILLCKNPKKVIKLLKQYKIEAINPLNEFELLGNPKKFPNAKNLTTQTVSLPCYPSLSDSKLIYIGKVLKKINVSI